MLEKNGLDHNNVKEVFEIINPHDYYTIGPAPFLPAALGILMVGNGAYGLKPVDSSSAVHSTQGKSRGTLPLFLFGGGLEWANEQVGDFSKWLEDPANLRSVASALSTVMIGTQSEQKEMLATLEALPFSQREEYQNRWFENKRSSLSNIRKNALIMSNNFNAKAKSIEDAMEPTV